MLTWETRPATSSPNTSWTMHRAGQASQGKLDFPFDAITIVVTDSCTGVVFYIFVVGFLATVNSFNCKERKEKNSDVYTLLIINREDNRPFLCTMATLYLVLLRPESFSLFFSSYLNLIVPVRSKKQEPLFAQESNTLKGHSSKIMLSCKWPNATPKTLYFVAGF